MSGPRTHTLAHLSQVNQRPDIALEPALSTLAALGGGLERALVARQAEVGENVAM